MIRVKNKNCGPFHSKGFTYCFFFFKFKFVGTLRFWSCMRVYFYTRNVNRKVPEKILGTSGNRQCRTVASCSRFGRQLDKTFFFPTENRSVIVKAKILDRNAVFRGVRFSYHYHYCCYSLFIIITIYYIVMRWPRPRRHRENVVRNDDIQFGQQVYVYKRGSVRVAVYDYYFAFIVIICILNVYL